MLDTKLYEIVSDLFPECNKMLQVNARDLKSCFYTYKQYIRFFSKSALHNKNRGRSMHNNQAGLHLVLDFVKCYFLNKVLKAKNLEKCILEKVRAMRGQSAP